MTLNTPPVSDLKAQAKRLRSAMSDAGTPLTHAQALEAIARQHGHRDWNTAHAAASFENPPRWRVGQMVRGRYLGQAFTGRIKALSETATGHWRMTLVFDAPVDVVTSPHFSNWRRQVNGVVNSQGTSAEKTSDGTPHLLVMAA
ncbi:glyoxalase superfamily protein [Rhodalgimonas zhirmunskyi]|uniref:Glyoxalase superfamily protein n=1 Tax=Rhodalgimonas zhirmunskyi TaxID=2964767 RepID=A0AAJ1UC54_9RHOB|nr:glyoxalase superfamily protein [Rhodoalgimonas zhirmunskyi]MDQ2095173.1 glyoxalase superfamily protein [Rhodoalgimonas zhirmunskyi]